MFNLLYALICIAIVTQKTCEVAAGIIPPTPKPPEFADQEGCYIESLNRILACNVPYSPQGGKSCVQYTCNEDGYTDVFACGVIGVGPGCVIVESNRTLPYPDCCDSIECE